MIKKILSHKIPSSAFLIPIGLSLIVSIIVLSSLRITFGLAVLILLILLSIRNPFLLIWVMFFAYILAPYVEYYSKSQLPFGIVFIFVFTWVYIMAFLKSQLTHQYSFKILLVDIINIAIIIIGVFLFIFSEDKTFALIGLKENLKMCFLFLFIRAIKPAEEELYKFIRIFLLIGIIVSLYGIYQYFFDYYSLINKFGGISDLTEGYFGLSSVSIGHLGAKRAYSFFLNNFTLAYYLMISLIIILVKISSQVIKKMDKMVFISLPILLCCFVLTFSRSAWMGFVIGSFFLFLVNKKWYFYKRFVVILLVMVVLSGFVIPFVPKNLQTSIFGRFTSIFSTDVYETSGHYEDLRKDITLLMRYPWGIGLGKGTPYIGEVWNESSLFKLTTEMGVIPGLLYVLVYFLTFIKGIRLYRKVSKTKQEIILITLGLTGAYFVSGIVFPVWMTWFPTMTVWILMAVAFNYGEENEKGFINNNRKL
jgi:hypothetical protein